MPVCELKLKTIGSWFKAINGSVKEIVTKFNSDIKDMILNVDWGAFASFKQETREQYGQVMSAIQSNKSKLKTTR